MTVWKQLTQHQLWILAQGTKLAIKYQLHAIWISKFTLTAIEFVMPQENAVLKNFDGDGELLTW